MKVEAVVERFRKVTSQRWKPESITPHAYTTMFRRFARHFNMEKKTRQDLEARGRDYILDFMTTLTPKSKPRYLAALMAYWDAMGLTWPIRKKRDFGRGQLPPGGHRETPADSAIRPWVEAVEHERDSWMKLLVLLELNYGWRPHNQLGRARWRWVRYDPEGRPVAFVTKEGWDELFKTNSRIVAYIPPVVADALLEWKKVAHATAPDDYILPWRGTRGNYHPRRGARFNAKPPPPRNLTRHTIQMVWQQFERKWGLPHLPPAYFRHWVKTTCRRLSDPSLAALQGHQPSMDRGMRNVYDTPNIEAMLDEQRTEFPRGAIGELQPPWWTSPGTSKRNSPS